MGDANILPNVREALKRARAIATELELDQQRDLWLSNRRAGDQEARVPLRSFFNTEPRSFRIDVAPLARCEKKISGSVVR